MTWSRNSTGVFAGRHDGSLDMSDAGSGNLASNAVNLTAPPRNPFRDWRNFCDEHWRWLGNWAPASDPIYCLPIGHLEAALRLFKLTETQIDAEQAFTSLCSEHHAIGFYREAPIRYKWLGDYLPLPAVDEMEEMLSLGWTREHIEAIRSEGAHLESVFRRMQAVAGRLITAPKFLAERDDLQSRWMGLRRRQRPSLPLVARARATVEAEGVEERQVQKLEPDSPQLSDFLNAYDAFRLTWELEGMATWDLPIPQGPLLPRMTDPGSPSRPQDTIASVPARFALRGEDDAGAAVKAAHRRRSESLGIDDHDSAERYATFLHLGHWRLVLERRYSRAQRIRGFKLQRELVLAETVGVSSDRVKRLLVEIGQLRGGSKASLKKPR